MLKTSLCDEKAEDEIISATNNDIADVVMHDSAVTENGKCPTCDPKIRQLGLDLPNSLHTLT